MRFSRASVSAARSCAALPSLHGGPKDWVHINSTPLAQLYLRCPCLSCCQEDCLYRIFSNDFRRAGRIAQRHRTSQNPGTMGRLRLRQLRLGGRHLQLIALGTCQSTPQNCWVIPGAVLLGSAFVLGTAGSAHTRRSGMNKRSAPSLVHASAEASALQHNQRKEIERERSRGIKKEKRHEKTERERESEIAHSVEEFPS